MDTFLMETYFGHLKTPHDAMILIEACRRGELRRVQRRLSSTEQGCIQSGSVFVWDEREAGMRRWTDGRTWSPSRVLGNFLTYRELSTKRRPQQHKVRFCQYKPNGLIKQSFSIVTSSHQRLHVVSYYTKADILSNKLITPSTDRRFQHIAIAQSLYTQLDSNISNKKSSNTNNDYCSSSSSSSRSSRSNSSSPVSRQDLPPSPPLSLSSSPCLPETSPERSPLSLPSIVNTVCTLPPLLPLQRWTLPEDERQLMALSSQLFL